MNEPVRLRDTGGAASALLGAGRLDVPHAARQRALAFTGVAAGLATTGVAGAAAATSLVKTVVLCVCLGTVGGGLLSLAASEALSGAQTTQADSKPAPASERAALPPPAAAVAKDQAIEPTVAPAFPAAAPVASPAPAAPAAAGAPVTPPAAATSSPGKPPRASNLFDEQRIIESARAAVSRGDGQSALVMLDGYARAYAQGQFGPEALALRIEALSHMGDLAGARRLAAEFRQSYPHHPLLARAQAVAEAPPATRR